MATLNEASAIVQIGHGTTQEVYGAYGEFIASALRDYTWAIFLGVPVPTADTIFHFDIATGLLGVEIPIVTEFTRVTIGGGGDWNDSYTTVCLPLKISTGDRVSARVKSGGVGGIATNYNCQIRLFV